MEPGTFAARAAPASAATTTPVTTALAASTTTASPATRFRPAGRNRATREILGMSWLYHLYHPHPNNQQVRTLRVNRSRSVDKSQVIKHVQRWTASDSPGEGSGSPAP